jgi:hypothetical protein
LDFPGYAGLQRLPNPVGYTGPKIVYLTSDGKLYSYVSGAWQVTIPEVSGVADGSITVAKFATGLEPVKIVTSVPGTKSTETVYNTTDGKLYRWNGTAYVATVPAADITGTLTNSQIADLAASKLTGQVVASQIADAAITTAKFAGGLAPVEIVGTLPVSGNFEGRTVYLTTDDKLYRYNGTSFTASVPSTDITGTLTNSQIADLAAAKLTGTIVSSQIADSSISTAKIAAGAITATQIAADTITSNQIAANAITSSELAANSVIAGKIQAGAITATEIATGAITTKQLAIYDFESVVPNGNFQSGDAANLFQPATGYTVVPRASAHTGTAPTTHVLQIASTVSGDLLDIFTNSKTPTKTT